MTDPSGGSGRPDPATARDPSEFVDAMRRLKRWSGLGFRRLEQRASAAGDALPRSTLTAALARDTLPREELVAAFARICGCGTAEVERWVATRRRLAAAASTPPQRKTAEAVAVPAQLPPAVAGFVGRTSQLDELTALLAADQPTVVITAIAGTAGVGKTALAVHWGHDATASFPDGCLYVDLRGYDPDEPLQPGAALGGFLRALGMDGGDIPYEPTERAAHYRTLLEGRRMLIVLDNARDTEQVRPLLPGTASCFVVVTSRDSLAGLVARHGAHRIDLDLLPPQDAVALLRKLICTRVDEDPDAAGTLAAHCARLPLALRIAAELAVARPAMTLDSLAGELADEHRQLELLDAGNDPRTAVRSVFSWSYTHLAADAARLFRLLGLHPGPDLHTHAAAALADVAADQARRLLDVLATAHLVQQTAPGRYLMHDLLRAWAREQTHAIDAEPDRRAALTRLFDWYLLSASTAVDLLYPHDRHRRVRAPIPATATITISDEDSARCWLDAERANLLAIGAHTAKNEWRSYAIQLSTTLHRHLTSTADFTSAQILHEHALAAALHHGDRAALAWTLTNLAATYSATGQSEQAKDLQQWALALHRDTGDRAGQARALTNLGTMSWRAGRYEHAIDYLHQSLTSFRDIGDPAGEARALMNLGATCWHSCDYKQAAAHFLAAQALFCDLNIPDGQVLSLCGVGAVGWRFGQYEPAADHLRRALALSQTTGDKHGEFVARTHLGVVYGRTGRHQQAIQHLQQAVALARDVCDQDGHADALTYLGEVYNRNAQHELAATCHREALHHFRECGDQSGLATASNGLGETACAAGDPIEALRAHQQAHDHADPICDRPQLARAHAGIGHAHHLLANPEQARAHWLQAHALYDKLGVPEAAEIRTHLTANDNLPSNSVSPSAKAPFFE